MTALILLVALMAASCLTAGVALGRILEQRELRKVARGRVGLRS